MSGINRTLIAGFPIFQGFSPEELDYILKGARSVRYPVGQALFEQGEQASSFFFLLHGYLRVTKTTTDGKQIGVRYINPGEFCGITPAFGTDRYPATSTPVNDSIVLVWPTSQWVILLDRLPKLGAKMMQTVGERLQESHVRVIELATQTADRRIANVILDLINKAGRTGEFGTEISFPVSRQDIAEMTGTTLHTVSRLLSAWEEQGIVKSGRRKIVIIDQEALQELADSTE